MRWCSDESPHEEAPEEDARADERAERGSDGHGHAAPVQAQLERRAALGRQREGLDEVDRQHGQDRQEGDLDGEGEAGEPLAHGCARHELLRHVETDVLGVVRESGQGEEDRADHAESRDLLGAAPEGMQPVAAQDLQQHTHQHDREHHGDEPRARRGDTSADHGQNAVEPRGAAGGGQVLRAFLQ